MPIRLPKQNRLNHNITLSEFKFIFYMEWAHRMWGRFIGLSFVLPGLYFARKGYMSRPIQFRSVVVGLMIGCQGLLGWLMVKSGLDHELMNTPNAMPRVSHYWLSAHLGSAFLIYSTMLLTGLEILQANKPLSFVRSFDRFNNDMENTHTSNQRNENSLTNCLTSNWRGSRHSPRPRLFSFLLQP